MKIAEQGYKYEQYMAFCPFYPWLLRILARTLHQVLQYFVSERSLLLACGWVLNTVFFALAALLLYRLTHGLFGKKNVALVSTLLFCFNPASAFMSSLYTESLFSCLQFTALCYLEEERSTQALFYTDAVSFVTASVSMRLHLPFTRRRSSSLTEPGRFENTFSNSLIIHAALTQPEHLILVRWMGLETQ